MAERAASGMLDRFWDKHGCSFPIDPIKIAHELGISVISALMSDEVSGALAKRQGMSPALYLNRMESPRRQVFTCAHELGHFYQAVEEGKEEFEDVYERGPEASTGRDPKEVFANQFAAALLMPADEVRKVNETHSVAEMMMYFGVSQEALKYRLTNLGLL